MKHSSTWQKHKQEHKEVNVLTVRSLGSDCWYCDDDANKGKKTKRYLWNDPITKEWKEIKKVKDEA